jgi:hypothetical protein
MPLPFIVPFKRGGWWIRMKIISKIIAERFPVLLKVSKEEF